MDNSEPVTIDEAPVVASEDILSSEIDRKPTVTVSIEGEDVKTVHVTGVRFKASGKIYYFSNEKKLQLKDGMNVIVDTARGQEYGEVAFADCEVKESSVVPPIREVIRIATDEDAKHHADNKKKEQEAFGICLEKIQKHGLDMKLIEAQYSFDNSKLLFYFTSASRVDFRELVKDLASTFRTRIELRQIGIRDEAKLMGGLGACGRSLCCSTFLPDFVQVSIRMAKDQNLSLNSGKISGLCGRLMCCLQYEHATYAEETAKTPPVDSVVKTENGIGYVTETNPLAGTIKVKLKDKPDMVPELYKRDDVTLISRPSKNNEDKD
ncbi:MAG: stage 0 sporulation family protein [Clostridia bacterium]|nr:stage 0 sporulation family protein [Clostridia bacterium]